MSRQVPQANKPGGNYVPVIIQNGFAFVSGQLPRRGDELFARGKLGAEISIETGQKAAALSAELCIAALVEAIGSLDRIEAIVRVTGYVASAPGFSQHAQVLNGASDRLIELLGERGRHSRTSVGVAELPRGAPVEIDMIAAVRA